MKNLMKLSYYLSFVFLIGLTACGGDDDDDDNVDCDQIAETLEVETQNLVDILFSSTEPDCNELLQAFDDLIDIIEDSRSCLTQEQQDELDNSIDQYEAARDSFECPG